MKQLYEILDMFNPNRMYQQMELAAPMGSLDYMVDEANPIRDNMYLMGEWGTIQNMKEKERIQKFKDKHGDHPSEMEAIEMPDGNTMYVRRAKNMGEWGIMVLTMMTLGKEEFYKRYGSK